MFQNIEEAKKDIEEFGPLRLVSSLRKNALEKNVNPYLIVDAAIIHQDLLGKLKKTNFHWQRTGSEKLAKRLDWTKKSINRIDAILTAHAQRK